MWILPLIFVIAAAAVGVSALCVLRLTKELVITVALGLTGGLASAVFLLYLLSPILPLGIPLVAIVTVALIAGSYILMSRYSGWNQFRQLKLDKHALTWAILLFILFSFVTPKLLWTSSTGLATGIINNFGDIAWHTELITSFAAGQSAPPTNPIYFGQRLTYPFLTDFASSVLLAGGASIVESIVLLATVLLPTLFVLFYLFAEKITRSRQAATIALLLLLFSGSTFGWLQLANDIDTAGGVAELISGSWRFYYSGSADPTSQYHLINALLGLILPQRSLLFGIPLAIGILWLLMFGDQKSKHPYIVAGIFAGILPLFHAHSVVALVLPILGLLLVRRSRFWLYFFAPAALLGLPQVVYYVTAPSQGAAISLQPGWMKPENTNFLLYWILNTGLLIPAAIAGLVMKTGKRLQLLTAAGLLLFVAANVWLIAPWEWDNTKVFLYWLIFTLPVIGWVAVEAMRRTPQWVNMLIVVGVVLHGVSGFIDLTYLMLQPKTYTVWDANAVQFAQQVQDITTKRAVIVTAPVHNSSIELTGRPRYIGYAGHVWSHGINGHEREQALARLYTGQATNLPEDIARYLVVSPAERATYPNLVIQPTWELLLEQGPYQLYRLP